MMAAMNIALMILKPFLFIVLISLVSSNFMITITNSKAATASHLVMKTTKVEFFFHDKVSGKHPTAVPIVKPNKSSSTYFGNLVMIDDLLTSTKDPKSTPVGWAQGMYGGADSKKLAVLMVTNFVFTDKSEYNGSTLAMLGRNEVLSPVREMPIVGGTGVFRYAQGFAQANTVWFNNKGDAIVHYKLIVSHY